MSTVNITSVKYTKFEDITERGNVIKYNYGFRIYTSDGQVGYCNIFKSFDELTARVNTTNIIKLVRSSFPKFYNSVELAHGLFLNGNWVELYDGILSI